MTTGQGSVRTTLEDYELEEMELVVNNKPYSVEIEATEMRDITPLLGENALRAMLIAGVAGLLVLAAAIIICYRVPGLNVCWARPRERQ